MSPICMPGRAKEESRVLGGFAALLAPVVGFNTLGIPANKEN